MPAEIRWNNSSDTTLWVVGGWAVELGVDGVCQELCLERTCKNSGPAERGCVIRPPLPRHLPGLRIKASQVTMFSL